AGPRIIQSADNRRFSIGFDRIVALHLWEMLFESGVILPDDVVVNNNNRRAMFVRESLQLGLGHFLNCCPGFRLFASSVQVKNGTIFQRSRLDLSSISFE